MDDKELLYNVYKLKTKWYLDWLIKGRYNSNKVEKDIKNLSRKLRNINIIRSDIS